MTAQEVIDHAKKQAKRGKHPSLPYLGVKNPRIALQAAIAEVAGCKVEILSFSKKLLFIQAESSGDLFQRAFYKGKEFNYRGSIYAKPNPWEDSVVVFAGVIKDSDIIYKSGEDFLVDEALRELDEIIS